MAKNEAVLEAPKGIQETPKAAIRGYCLYARKLSESDEMQALSIDSQIKEMEAMAEGAGV